MPVERISKGFKDISATFKISPLNNDTIALKNETAISRSIRNLVFTQPGERFFNPLVGSRISAQLFENMDPINASAIEDEIRNTIDNYEPRVTLIDVNVRPDYDNNEFSVLIKYRIIGIDALPQQLSFALQPTR